MRFDVMTYCQFEICKLIPISILALINYSFFKIYIKIRTNLKILTNNIFIILYQTFKNILKELCFFLP